MFHGRGNWSGCEIKKHSSSGWGWAAMLLGVVGWLVNVLTTHSATGLISATPCNSADRVQDLHYSVQRSRL